ncbi:hypothetical protein CDL15_Pgr021579 [Punica granatum]|uniref:Uncharacterized protein n=1 Tax=Punica granatum TaxID=22663 RepID=A0A218WRI8_PUNGR|nr:hypothetical protein CDL15_Pgr021579 [Punica granatum]
MAAFKGVKPVSFSYAFCIVFSLLISSSLRARAIGVAAANGPFIGYDPIRRGQAPPCKEPKCLPTPLNPPGRGCSKISRCRGGLPSTAPGQ